MCIKWPFLIYTAIFVMFLIWNILCTLHEYMTKLCTLKVDIENVTICSQNDKKYLFLNSSFLQWRTYTSNNLFLPLSFFLLSHKHKRVKPLSLLFFFSIKFLYPTFGMARPTPKQVHTKNTKKGKKKPTLNVIIFFHIWNQAQSKNPKNLTSEKNKSGEKKKERKKTCWNE